MLKETDSFYISVSESLEVPVLRERKRYALDVLNGSKQISAQTPCAKRMSKAKPIMVCQKRRHCARTRRVNMLHNRGGRKTLTTLFHICFIKKKKRERGGAKVLFYDCMGNVRKQSLVSKSHDLSFAVPGERKADF